MAGRIHVLLMVSGMAVVCVVAAVVYVATRSETNPPAVSATPSNGRTEAAAAPSATQTPAEPVVLPRTREPDQPAASGAPPSPEEIAQTTGEKKNRESADEVARQTREQVRDELKLGPEQMVVAEPALAGIGNVNRAGILVGSEVAARFEPLKKQLTPEQWDGVLKQLTREVVAERQGELLQCVDEAIQAFEVLRPHLTAEQARAFDFRFNQLQKIRERLLLGDPTGF